MISRVGAFDYFAARAMTKVGPQPGTRHYVTQCDGEPGCRWQLPYTK